jgi:hypothetical protein
MTDQEKIRRAIDSGEFWGDMRTLGPLLVDAVKEARDETASACRMLAKLAWRGPWDKTPEEWEAIGRSMAGLREAPAGGVGGVGVDDAARGGVTL